MTELEELFQSSKENTLSSMIRKKLVKIESTIEELEVQESKTVSHDCSLIPFTDWLAKYRTEIGPLVKEVKISVEQVDLKNTLCFSVQKDEKTRDLFLFKNSTKIMIPDLKPIYFNILSENIYVSTLDTKQNLFLKVYKVRTGLIVSFCYLIDSYLIPYYQLKVKNKDKGFKYVFTDKSKLELELNKQVDVESIETLYKQATKAKLLSLQTNMEMVKWFAERIKETKDLNHLVLIDQILIFMLTRRDFRNMEVDDENKQ